jgi:hypothetical protein
MSEDVVQKLQTEITKLFKEYWVPLLEEEYPVIEKINGYRTKIKKIENFEKVINLLKKLSPITIGLFLKKFGSLEQFPGKLIYNDDRSL